MIYYKLATVFIFLFGCKLKMFSQKKITYQAKVVSDDYQPISGADVILKEIGTDDIFGYSTTDLSGSFMLKIIPNKYIIEINHFAFEKHKDSISLFKDKLEDKIILKTKTENLSEINIKSRKPLVEHKIDRLVINIDKNTVFKGSNSFALLEHAPGIYSTGDDKLNIMGKTGVKIMIDGKLKNLQENEISKFLRTLPAEEVESIEILTTPPSKYDSDGNAGIINIIRRKNKNNNFTGNININNYKGEKNRIRGQAGIQYQKNKINLSTSYSGGIVNSFEELEQNNNFLLNEEEQIYDSFGFEDRELFYNTFNSQIDIDINSNSLLTIASRCSISVRDNFNTNNTFQSTTDGLSLGTFETLTQENRSDTNLSTDIYYEHRLDSLNKKVSVSTNYAQYNTLNNQKFTNSFDTDIDQNDEELRSNYDKKSNILALQIDFTLPYPKYLLEFGSKNAYTSTDNSFLFENLENANWLSNEDLSNDFNYKEINLALYFSLQKELSDKINLKAGLRGEFTQTKGNSTTLNETTKYDYFELFPTLYVEYKIKKKYKVNFTYSRRIDRPFYSYLNPFVSFQNSFFSNQGNPLLRPEFTHSIEFNNVIDNKIVITPFYNFTEEYFSEFPKNIPDSVETRYTFENLGTTQNFGVQAILPFTFNNKINLQQTFLGFYQYYNLSFNDTKAKPEGFFWMYNFSLDYAFNEKLKAQISGYYESKNIQGFYKVDYNADLDFNVSYSFLKEKASINFGVSDILYKNRSIVNITYPEQTLEFKRFNDTRLFKIGFTYRFSKNKLKNKTSFQSASNQEQNRN